MMKIGKRKYFICLECHRIFSCRGNCENNADFCVCDGCLMKYPNFFSCNTRLEKDEKIELLLKLRQKV